jgi:hypothetical protein
MARKARVYHKSRTEIVDIIINTRGRIFTVTYVKKNGKTRVMNCNKKDAAATSLGYLRVWDMQKRGNRTVDPRTVTALAFNGRKYQVKD